MTVVAGSGFGLSVSLGLWQDRPAAEALATARLADELGYDELWIGEMATYDAFALATAVGARTARIPLTVGPLAVTVRDPATIAMGAASVRALTGRRVSVALGTSSTVVVEEWHGRSRARAGVALAESARQTRELLDGAKSDGEGEVVRSRGYRLRLPAPGAAGLTVAAFGAAAVRTAARYADRLVLNLVSAEAAGDLVLDLERAAREAGRPRPRVAAWVCAAVGSDTEQGVEQMRRGLVGYLAAPGYGEMFARAGFGELVAFARTRPHPRELLAAIPPAAVEVVGLGGTALHAAARIARYRAAGVEEVVVVPSATDADPAGEATLWALASMAVPG
ncbi:LLM class F420-dependent oxidoreductase [Streptomyces sp. SID3343]|uniref:LLM class F420-dependent oxidoreductase n=1 Tax=Streptomyces sp. SID3343 TaxID=2690260 RepID=UPI001368569D|nr:LLM class F420-dependent oxidoreductase [Streptomyces sp. SID3343]MYW02264.1 LLM class F420-dependent oxidoreductase [Streptomyces sp. SID3343]